MRILEELKGCRTIGISGHENPDGDCAGSCMGLALFLRKTMPEARVDVFLEPLRHELAANIPGSGTIITDFRTDTGFPGRRPFLTGQQRPLISTITSATPVPVWSIMSTVLPAVPVSLSMK